MPSAATRELLEGRSAAAVIAFVDPRIADSVRDAFCAPALLVSASQDVVGCEIAGAVTTVIAIAAGICTGLRTGENTRAAVITEGLAELIRLGIALGADARTFVGLAGMGDVIVTSACSDNVERRVGEELATGRDIADIVDELGHAPEGVNAVASVIELGRAHGVMLPIAAEVDAIINRGSSAAMAFRRLRPVSAVPDSNGAWVALPSPRW
jgi:glycerol-3-phosphate dehydrogenase (NAD(P)+)